LREKKMMWLRIRFDKGSSWFYLDTLVQTGVEIACSHATLPFLCYIILGNRNTTETCVIYDLSRFKVFPLVKLRQKGTDSDSINIASKARE